jgi:tetratricopeptide (TPR) repeat protein
VVDDALRAAPDDPDLLAMLGRIHAGRGDWGRVRQAAERLRATGYPAAAPAADRLDVAALRGEGRDGEALALLERLAAAGDPEAMAEAVRGRLEAGDPTAAQAFLAGLLARDPADPAARLLQAELLAEAGDPAAAEAAFRALAAEDPARPEPHRALAGLLVALGRPDEARAAVEAGLAATGGDPGLLFARAGLLEADGDLDGAIAAYEALYARDAGAPVVANNLASLLAGRGDPEGLERAFAIARRLEGTDEPHFRDTWGWILHRRGESARALPHLEAAAAALPDNAQVQFHLGEAELALGDRAAARAAFTAALAAAEAGSPLPQAATARARAAELAAASSDD